MELQNTRRRTSSCITGVISEWALTQHFVEEVHVEFAICNRTQRVLHSRPQPIGEIDHQECTGEKVFGKPVGARSRQVNCRKTSKQVIKVLHHQLIRIEGQHPSQPGGQAVQFEGQHLEQAVDVVIARAGRKRGWLLNMNSRGQAQCGEIGVAHMRGCKHVDGEARSQLMPKSINID